tara:strand:+ start:252 stop:1115 length:864 start_codon:yes stop_codon:yes gene_type:complete
MAKKNKSEAAISGAEASKQRGFKMEKLSPAKEQRVPTLGTQDAQSTVSDWQIKDRVYYLRSGLSPLTYTIKSRGIYWFDEEKGYERELKYTTNQKTPFVDEFKGDSRLGHIVFVDGVLKVPREKQTLQKVLSLYHPDKGRIYSEFDAIEEAKDELIDIEMEIEALNIAKNLDIDQAEAILRVDQGNKVSTMTSKEIKRDVLLFTKRNPRLLMELVQDENVELRNVGIKAVEAGILALSGDNRTFNWASNNRKVMTVPFDENPYSALAAYFKTDDGIELYQTIEKRLK